MEYSRVPRFVGRDTVEYGYFPQNKTMDLDDSVYWNEPYLQDENQLRVLEDGEQVFFADGKFYFHCLHGVYEYEPLLWRVYSQEGNLLYLISDKVLFHARVPLGSGGDAFRVQLERKFRQTAVLVQDRYLEEIRADSSERAISLAEKSSRPTEQAPARVFLPSRLDCQKMKEKDLRRPSSKPILTRPQTMFSAEGLCLFEFRGSPFFTSFRPENDNHQLCFEPSADGLSDFQTERGSGVRPCIIIKEENIIKEEK